MKKNGVYETVHELIHAVKKLRTNQPLKWLNVPTINAFKRRNVKGLLRATVVWQWGEALLQHHPQVQARHTYYYAQIWPDNKPIKKYFFLWSVARPNARTKKKGVGPDTSAKYRRPSSGGTTKNCGLRQSGTRKKNCWILRNTFRRSNNDSNTPFRQQT